MRNAKTHREVISLHVGGAGVNLGGALWELFCVEHGIDLQGKQKSKATSIQKNFFFTDKASGRMVPRSIFVDLQPSSYLDPFRLKKLGDEYLSPIDRIKTGPHRDLFEDE